MEFPNTLEDAVNFIEALRQHCLFGDLSDQSHLLPPFCTEHFMQSLAYMQLAERSMQMADYCRMQKQ